MIGFCQLVLHAHLPFVRHPEHPFFMEEHWLFEAMSETYLPLVALGRRLDRDGVPGTLTVSLSMPLVSMLDDPLLRERFDGYLSRLVRLAEEEIERTRQEDPAFHHLAHWYHRRFVEQREMFDRELGRDVAGAFAALHRSGRIELITCVGTHGYLPLMSTDASRRGQIRTSCEAFEDRFGWRSRGVWMGECAYVPGVEQLLADEAVQYTFVDAHGILTASAPAVRGLYAPLSAPSGVCFFGRDPESSEQVWSAESGYPGDPRYREFYRDVGFDRPYEAIAPYVNPDGVRMHTGIKYYRVTARGTDDKAPWNPDWAMDAVRSHAADFVRRRRAQVSAAAEGIDLPPLVTSPYDAELFGHWWFEGPAFLEAVLREAAHQDEVVFTTPGRYLDAYPRQQEATPGSSSWGEDGYHKVWLDSPNAWIRPFLHDAECRLQAVVRRTLDLDDPPNAALERALNQAARELMLAQASDWAFILYTGTTMDYAAARTRDHVEGVHRLLDMVDAGAVDEDVLELMESRSPIFPGIRYANWV
ncbi:MAG: DUF1957 domain-containing protein [Deltaproteobacteria bacterium]|nr:MAG: DUF1957 domain-containing protein [Deltaproteobacteria bacterium]